MLCLLIVWVWLVDVRVMLCVYCYRLKILWFYGVECWFVLALVVGVCVA